MIQDNEEAARKETDFRSNGWGLDPSVVASCRENLRLSSLSVIFPAFNEQCNIQATVESARRALFKLSSEWEIIVVNDGSYDWTRDLCDSLARKYSEMRVIHHAENLGYGAALKSGIKAARCEWIFFSDADGQFDLEDLSKLVKRAGDCDVIAGFRRHRRDPFYRSINAWGWNMLVRLVLGIRVRDIDCAFKLFHRKVFERVEMRAVGAMVNTEILAQALGFGFRIAEVEVTHHPRRAGRATGARPAVIVKAFRELFRLSGNLRAIRPIEQERATVVEAGTVKMV